MNDVSKIKETLTPSIVVQYYLGTPLKSNRLGLWYKSPFRNERTASFLVNDVKGIHDFGTSIHYDIISFVQELFRIDFKTAINKLHYDFGIIDCGQSSKELEVYLIKKRQEEIQIKRNLEKWFYTIFIALCKELQKCTKEIPSLKGEVLAKSYARQQYLDYLADIFINATEDEKIELWKDKEEIEKCLQREKI